MGKVKVFTNSVSDLSPALAEHYNIGIVPDTIIFGDQSYRNNIDIDPPALYALLRTVDKLPTSSHPNIGQYMDSFQSAEGYEEIVCVNLTSKMSGSYNTACIARQMMEERGFPVKIYPYDSLQVSFGMSLMAIEAAKLAQQGKNAAEILMRLDEIKGKIGVYFVMQSLQNARKGGRVGAIRVLAADLLGVKPVLMFRDGLVRDVGIVRSFEAGIEGIIGYYRKQARRGGKVFLFHANNEPDARRIQTRILEIDPDAKISIEWVGAVIGIYTGEGCVGIAFHE